MPYALTQRLSEVPGLMQFLGQLALHSPPIILSREDYYIDFKKCVFSPGKVNSSVVMILLTLYWRQRLYIHCRSALIGPTVECTANHRTVYTAL